MTRIIDPSIVAKAFRDEIRAHVAEIDVPIKLVGFLPTDASRPSRTYARYTLRGCEDVGIHFELREVDKFDLERSIVGANRDPAVHGIIVYYPIFGLTHDNYLKDQIDFRKDVEGLNTHWLRMLYRDERVDELGRKSILPCTPLAIVKLLEEIEGLFDRVHERPPLTGRTVTIFNRSEVVGRPLAHMLANDGARVLSFDIDGPVELVGREVKRTQVGRAEALSGSDLVITGVPSRDFELVQQRELKHGAVCINFSTMKNFADDVETVAKAFVPRVGPMTVTMALRNTLRLFDHYHGGSLDLG